MSPSSREQSLTILNRRLTWHKVVTPLALLAALPGYLVAMYTVTTARTHIMPPAIEKGFWVSGTAVSDEYLEGMSDYVLSTILNVSPANVDYHNKQLLRLADPGAVGELRAALESSAARLKKDGASTLFSPDHITVDANNLTVKTSGLISTYFGDKQTSQVQRVWLVEFAMRHGKIYVKQVKDLTDSERSSNAAL